jgi:hypothetical protein
MFITFSSDAYENISYFNEIGRRLITLMGHSDNVPGAIKSEELADALARLQQGLGGEKIAPASSNNDDDNEPEISLAKRAIPLVNLLQAAIKKECDVLWNSSKSPG